MRKVISKSKKNIIYIIFGLIVFFSSCSNMSLFEGFDVPNTEEISNYTGEKLLLELEKNKNSKRFYESLTKKQTEKILTNLDIIIDENLSSENQADINIVTIAASCAIDICIYTDPLTYAVIFDLVDPIIIAITGKNASASLIFSSYTEPLQETVVLDKTTALNVISQCFENLCKITAYYDIGVISALSGSFSGADLQKYLVAGLLSGIVSGTQEALASSTENISMISEQVAQLLIDWENAVVKTESLLAYLFSQLPASIGDVGLNVLKAYKNQLLEKAEILGKIAENAGYKNLAKGAIAVLKSWAK